MQQLQEEIVSTKNKLSFLKQAYNDSTESFNSYVQGFPSNIIAGFFGKSFQVFSYWQLDKSEIKKKEDYIARL